MTNARFARLTLVASLACSLLGVGGRSFGRDGEGSAAAGEPGPEEHALAWSASEDGKLSLRVVTANGPLAAGEPVWVLAELRNDSDETLVVLKPFGDRYAAEAAGFEIAGPDGNVPYRGPKLDYVLGADAFTRLVPGEVLRKSWSTDALQDWLRLTTENYPGLGTPGRYTLRYAYRATADDQEAARQTGRFGGQERLWTGAIRTGPVTVTKAERPRGDGGEPVRPISVRLPAGEYRFTLAEAAAGVRFDYDLVVAEDLEEVEPLPQDAGGASDAGPSGLRPLETISGGGQSYGLFDVGLAPAYELPPRRVGRGTYPHSLVWDGRNWGGPSDTSTPKGEPFPPGTYTLRVRVKGEVVTPEGRKPYDVSDTAEIVLTP